MSFHFFARAAFAAPLIAITIAACGGSGDAQSADGGASDAGPRDAARTDAGPPPFLDASACQPSDVTTFQAPAFKPATGRHQNKCTPSQIDDLYAACLAPTATASTCAPKRTELQSCAACVFSQESDPKWGAVVQYKGYAMINVAGCVEVEAGAAGLSCAKDMQASLACSAAACAANCPVVDARTFASFSSCTEAAARTGCAAFSEKARCVDDLAQTTSAAVCTAGATFADRFHDVARVICGSGAQDAGGGG
jgi:hypothetical protein